MDNKRETLLESGNGGDQKGERKSKCYMNLFRNADEFVCREFSVNHGTQSPVSKGQLLEVALKNEIKATPAMKKTEICDRICEKLGARWLLENFCSVGVRSIDIQIRFGVSHRDVKKLEKSGFLKISGYQPVYIYGKYRKVPLYDPYQVYALTDADVQDALKSCPTPY